MRMLRGCRCRQSLAFYAYFTFFTLSYAWLAFIFFTGEGAVKAKDPRKESEGAIAVVAPLPEPISLNHPSESTETDAQCPRLKTTPPIHLCILPPSKDHGFSATLAAEGIWEPKLTKALGTILKAETKAIFVDVGAFLGYYSILAASWGRPVLAIEPFPDARALLSRSAQLNGLSRRIRLYPMAASKEAENLTFVVSGTNLGGRFALHSEQARFNHRGERQERIEAFPLDALLNSQPIRAAPSLVLKLDVEGWECAVIAGAARLLEKTSHLILEWEQSRRRGAGDRCLRSALARLRELRFRPATIDGEALVHFHANPFDDSLPQDILWRRSPSKPLH